MSQQFDIAIIGGGPGGYVAALRAAKAGKKIAVIEKGLIGGTCLNRGCIPTKTLLHAAESYRAISEMAAIGITVEKKEIDFGKVQEHKSKVIAQLRGGVEFLLKKNRVTVIAGEASFKSKDTLEVKTKDGIQEVKAKNIIIATGSTPAVLPIPVDEGVKSYTAEELMDIKDLPEDILILGGGAIGIEFATIFNSLGVKVTLVELLDRLIPREDHELSAMLLNKLKKDGINVHVGTKVTKITAGEGGRAMATLEGHSEEEEIATAAVLASVGRKPVIQGLNLEDIGVEMNRGTVIADDLSRTNVDGIYAVGDVTGKNFLAHGAMEAGLIAAEDIIGEQRPALRSIMPRCIFSNPEIAAVGMTEVEAKEEGYEIKVGRFPFNANGRALTLGETTGMVKIISEKETGEVLGVHIMGPHASTLIGEACLAMSMEATLEELIYTLHPHPTISEALQESAFVAAGLPLHTP